ncbi:MAG: sigma-54 dependent transcriptional regulator [Acidobacteriota bacterium]
MARDDGTKVLVVDDDAAMREVLEMRLGEWGFDVSLAEDGDEARRLAERLDPAVVISDVVLPDLTGIELLESLKAGNRHRPVILITAYGTVDVAVEAMKLGARDFLTKPLDYRKLRSTLAAAESDVAGRRSVDNVARRLEGATGLGAMIGVSKAMKDLFELIKVLAASDASAIITGESGTGKELVARTLHDLSPRRQGPFVALNSAAIPEGLTESELFGHEKGAFTGAIAARPGCFEMAHQGTLFLDEIAEMPINLQPKLLRVLEDGRVRRLAASREFAFDVRLLAATNREPEQAVRDGLLRQDLYYRLNVFTLCPPPLRQRREDIPLLAHSFVQRLNAKYRIDVGGFDETAGELLDGYSWPGNVRELRNVVERAVILAREGLIEPHHLPPHIQDPSADRGEEIVLPREVTFAEAEEILITETLKRCGNNKAETARRLGVDVKTIRNKLRAFGERRP